ncbi:MAG: type II toxin-antitoxin system RelE/ParE family toxin [Petrimonas sp.]|nr:type II toxin-antitoxin system RelE/ParE family toxin [Petrimonas sp.]
MAEKTIIWSERADDELKGILEFYNTRNGNTKYSFKLLAKIEEISEILSKNEYIGRLADDKKTRVIVMDAYLIFYEIDEFQINILSFWDNRQNPENRIDKI